MVLPLNLTVFKQLWIDMNESRTNNLKNGIMFMLYDKQYQITVLSWQKAVDIDTWVKNIYEI